MALMTPSDRAEPCLPALTHEQWIAARDRMLDSSSIPAARHAVEAALERAFGPCPAKPVLPFELVTQGGSKVTLKKYGWDNGLLVIRDSQGTILADTLVSKSDLRRIAVACLKAAKAAA